MALSVGVLVFSTAASVVFFSFLIEDGFGYLCAPGPNCFIFYHPIGELHRCVCGGGYLTCV